MTTAARPTFEPAKGGMGKGERDLSALSKQYSARDLPSHTRLKYREHGQGSQEETRNRDFRRELEERERTVLEKRRGPITTRPVEQPTPTPAVAAPPTKKSRLEPLAVSNLDADDPQDEDCSDADSDSDGEDDAALYAELERIRRERAQDEARKERDRAEQEERIRMENIISGNPLLSVSATKNDLKVRRRWDDDVVFKNCAGGEGEGRKEKAFINDALRSDFHKRFMEKYVK